MKSYSVKITPAAKNQMLEIRDYITKELQNPNAAKNLMQEMKKEFTSLKQMPARAKITDEEPWVNNDLRWLSVKNYLVYFWIEEEKEIVHITAVVYARRDQRDVLKRMKME